MDTVNVWAKFEVRSFTRSWDNSGYLKKNFGQSLDTPFKVTQGLDFGTNRKRVYDFLSSYQSVIVTLVLSCTVSEILQVFLRSRVTPPLFRSQDHDLMTMRRVVVRRLEWMY